MTPTVIWIHDDGSQSLLDEAITNGRLPSEYHNRLCIPIHSDLMYGSSDTYSNPDQLRDAYNRGAAIMNHSMKNLRYDDSSFNTEGKIAQHFLTCANALVKEGMPDFAFDGTLPENAKTGETFRILHEKAGAQFLFGDNDENDGVPVLLEDGGLRSSTSNKSVPYIKGLIDNTIANNLHLGIYGHHVRIPVSPEDSTSQLPDEYEETADYLAWNHERGYIYWLSFGEYKSRVHKNRWQSGLFDSSASRIVDSLGNKLNSFSFVPNKL